MVFIQNIHNHAQTENLAIDRHIKSHKVNINGNTLYGAKKMTSIGVNSMHHQGVILNDSKINLDLFKSHQYINVVAWSNKIDLDEDMGNDPILVEGIQVKLWNNNIVAVQWHPEELKDIELIDHFFNNSYKEKKVSKFNFDAPPIKLKSFEDTPYETEIGDTHTNTLEVSHNNEN